MRFDFWRSLANFVFVNRLRSLKLNWLFRLYCWFTRCFVLNDETQMQFSNRCCDFRQGIPTEDTEEGDLEFVGGVLHSLSYKRLQSCLALIVSYPKKRGVRWNCRSCLAHCIKSWQVVLRLKKLIAFRDLSSNLAPRDALVLCFYWSRLTGCLNVPEYSDLKFSCFGGIRAIVQISDKWQPWSKPGVNGLIDTPGVVCWFGDPSEIFPLFFDLHHDSKMSCFIPLDLELNQAAI
jgi:hypothetical protein